MNHLIETMNLWGDRLGEFAGSMLFQSSLVICAVWVLDWVLRRKLRPAVRYGLWIVVLVKLVLPPSLALPTGIGWWDSQPVEVKQPNYQVVSSDFQETSPAPAVSAAQPQVASEAAMSTAAWRLVAWAAISLSLLAWLTARWIRVAQCVNQSAPAPEALARVLEEACERLKARRRVELRVTDLAISPAVCGLLRPVILLPSVLAGRLSNNQLRAVLLHELIHIRRGDIWVNVVQSGLQIFYWWHPLLWLANARMRRLREEAVDDAAVASLAEESDDYAPALLEVAKWAFDRSLTGLGLVGVLESRSALRVRIERLINSKKPKIAGLTILSALGIGFFLAIVVPMGKAPQKEPVPLGVWQARNFDRSQLSLLTLENPAGRTTSSNTVGRPITLEIKFIECSNFDPASQPSDSPLRQLPKNVLTNTPQRETPAMSKLRSKFSPEALRLETCPNPIVTAVLSQEQAKAFIKTAEQTSGTDLLSAPKVTTRSGSSAKSSVQDVMTVVSGVSTSVTTATNGNPAQAQALAEYSTTTIGFGPEVLVTPHLQPDGDIDLDVRSQITEFRGYDKPDSVVKIEIQGRKPLTAVKPQPRIRLTEFAGRSTLKDGQTLLLGGPVVYDTTKVKDKVPYLGDLPGVGRFFRSESSYQIKKHIILLVTPRLEKD